MFLVSINLNIVPLDALQLETSLLKKLFNVVNRNHTLYIYLCVNKSYGLGKELKTRNTITTNMIDFKDEIITPEQIQESKRFTKAARKAFRLGLLDSERNSMTQHMPINNKKYMRKLLKEGKIDKKLIEDLEINV
jgi:hypothetical protein